MTVFFGYDTPLYMYNGKPLTISNSPKCIMEDTREIKFPIQWKYGKYCESVGREMPDPDLKFPINWTNNKIEIVRNGKNDFYLTDAVDEENITFVISSYGHYARVCVGECGQIQVLRRFTVPPFPNTPKDVNEESVNHVNGVYVGNIVESCGQTVSAKTAIITVKNGTDAVIRITRSGYPARFKKTGIVRTWFLVATGGEFYAVPDSEITGFFGGKLPWKCVDETEFYRV